MIEKGFPAQLRDDVEYVLRLLPLQTYGNVRTRESQGGITYQLTDGQEVTVPYRIYCEEISDCLAERLTFAQKLIYHAIYTRSCNGYAREKHLRAILAQPYPDWMIPYVVKPADEYVVEIVSLLYNSLKDADNTAIRDFWKRNIQQLLYSHARMISYWDVFYRGDCYEYRNYIGKKLFEDCFGYTRSMERMRKAKTEQ